MATNAATTWIHRRASSLDRSQTITAAPRQNASATTTALRTVDSILGEIVTPANVWTNEAGATSAQMAKPATIPNGTSPITRS